VETVIENFAKKNTSLQENRGGYQETRKVVVDEKVEAVIKFIKLFPVHDTHYCRSKLGVRKYLSGDLSIGELYRYEGRPITLRMTQSCETCIYNAIFKMFSRLYNKQAEVRLQVKKTFFYKIFNTKFNLGFGSPATDACSTCLEFRSKIKCEKDPLVKAQLEGARQIHRKRKNAFFDLVREEKPDMITLCFDCEKNLALPKIPDSITYYSRQLYLYNFTITEGSSHGQLNPNTVWCYTWMEDEYCKGSNEIASALLHRLNNLTISANVKVIRLIADGCPGQNKNSTLLTAVSSWLLHKAPQEVTELELVFPVTGHSFIPPDCVFGEIEQAIKKREEIILPFLPS
jgi:hypothetical protein